MTLNSLTNKYFTTNYTFEWILYVWYTNNTYRYKSGIGNYWIWWFSLFFVYRDFLKRITIHDVIFWFKEYDFSYSLMLIIYKHSLITTFKSLITEERDFIFSVNCRPKEFSKSLRFWSCKSAGSPFTLLTRMRIIIKSYFVGDSTMNE